MPIADGMGEAFLKIYRRSGDTGMRVAAAGRCNCRSTWGREFYSTVAEPECHKIIGKIRGYWFALRIATRYLVRSYFNKLFRVSSD